MLVDVKAYTLPIAFSCRSFARSHPGRCTCRTEASLETATKIHADGKRAPVGRHRHNTSELRYITYRMTPQFARQPTLGLPSWG